MSSSLSTPFGRLLVAAVVVGGLVVAADAGSAVAAGSSAIATHVDNCGGAVTVRSPARAGGTLSAAQAGIPVATAFFAKAAARHVTWLSSISCQAVPNRKPRLAPQAALPADNNWSGYVAATSAPNYAQAEWTVPSVKTNGKASYSSIWPGIGGYSGTGKLIQDGTEEDASASGAQTDYFWYEIVPGENQEEITNLKPKIGDDVTTDIFWASGTADFAICDNTKSTCVTGSQSSTAPGNTAEWIVERTQINGKLPELADFTSVKLSNCYYDENRTGGAEYTISNGGESLAMDGSSGDTLAAPGATSSGGTAFTDTWHNYS